MNTSKLGTDVGQNRSSFISAAQAPDEKSGEGALPWPVVVSKFVVEALNVLSFHHFLGRRAGW